MKVQYSPTREQATELSSKYQEMLEAWIYGAPKQVPFLNYQAADSGGKDAMSIAIEAANKVKQRANSIHQEIVRV